MKHICCICRRCSFCFVSRGQAQPTYSSREDLLQYPHKHCSFCSVNVVIFSDGADGTSMVRSIDGAASSSALLPFHLTDLSACWGACGAAILLEPCTRRKFGLEAAVDYSNRQGTDLHHAGSAGMHPSKQLRALAQKMTGSGSLTGMTTPAQCW